ncbi:hypothetical protein GW796_05980 [archaeon]|nr:hypothetical protein [archaeon]NCQ51433.1 hypothetical protein [archaeon]NCT58741.1 hypothetical protein [archaeon]
MKTKYASEFILAGIKNLRMLNENLFSYGVMIELIEDTGNIKNNQIQRKWGNTTGNSREVLNAMLNAHEILHIELPEGLKHILFKH